MNNLYYGDNLQVLRDSVKDETIDLVYLDPPFNSQANYNLLFQTPTGQLSQAQVEAFKDTWHWDKSAENAFDDVMASGNTKVAEMLRAFRSFLGMNDMMAYLAMMAVRMLELHRVLKPTGSLYLHCDPTASHYLKVLVDAVFEPVNFRNEIIWRRTGSHNTRRRFGPIHDTLLFYSKSNRYTFNIVKRPYMKGHVAQRYTLGEDGRSKFTSGGNILTGSGIRTGDSGAVWRGFDPTAKRRHWAVPGFLADQMQPEFLDLSVTEKLEALYAEGLVEITGDNAWPTPVRFLGAEDGQPVQDLWTAQPYTEGTVHESEDIIDADVAWLGTTDLERLGYPTQKPSSLLSRILRASSNEGDLVLDPFCGCGTTIHAAEKLKRRWTGIDVTHLAISLIETRVLPAFTGVVYEVHGTPKDLAGAAKLAATNPYEFQWWAVALINAIPYANKKRGADGGIDGLIYFKPEGPTEKAIISVKGGLNVGVSMVRELENVVDSSKAKLGILILLTNPTGPMTKTAVGAGFYAHKYGKHYKIQILTIQDILSGKRPDIPRIDRDVSKKAAFEGRGQGKLV